MFIFVRLYHCCSQQNQPMWGHWWQSPTPWFALSKHSSVTQCYQSILLENSMKHVLWSLWCANIIIKLIWDADTHILYPAFNPNLWHHMGVKFPMVSQADDLLLKNQNCGVVKVLRQKFLKRIWCLSHLNITLYLLNINWW